MKKISFFLPLLIIITVLSGCIKNPQGDKVDSGDAFAIAAYDHEIELKADIENSRIEWLGTKPGGNHYGNLLIKEGSIFVKDGQILGGKFILDMNSITVLDIENPEMNAYLINHLKSPDFFHVDSFPKAFFEFSSITPIPQTQENPVDLAPTHRIDGNLTIRGITKGISFNALINHDERRLRASTSQFLINRTHWGVNYGSQSIFANLKDNIIHDEMGVTIHLLAF